MSDDRPLLTLWTLATRSVRPTARAKIESLCRGLFGELGTQRIAMYWCQGPDSFLQRAAMLMPDDRPHGVLVVDPWDFALPWVVRGGLQVLGVTPKAPRSSLWFSLTEPPPTAVLKARVIEGDAAALAKRISYQLRHRYKSPLKGARGAQRAADPPGKA